MKRRKCVCRLPIAFLGVLVCGVVLWQIAWILLQRRNVPIHFDTAVLKDFKYLNELTPEDKADPLGRYGYHVINSRGISLLRTLPKTRHFHCKSKEAASAIRRDLPPVSVVITFTDVDRSVLLRNVVSILTRSAPVTVIEIILVDDGSQSDEEGKLVSELPGVSVLRNEQQKGRGAARMQGLAKARGDVIVFVDCLAEVNKNWLSPLVSRLVKFPKSIVSPVIDLIDHETFEYKSFPGLFRGGFDWSLQVHWEEVPAKHHSYDDPTEPFRSPLLTGSVFAVRREFFSTIGGYDLNHGAKETEDLELSLRSWMCGEQIEIVPCSRVGVIHSSDSDFGKQEISFISYMRSARRVAELWLDEYKRFFYSTRPTARMQYLPDLASQKKLKERLKCKSFKWYLSYVYQQLQPLIHDEVAYGFIRQDTDCIDVDPGQLPLLAKLRGCHHGKSSQEWSWRKRGVIVSNGMCLTADLMHLQGYVSVQFCKDIDTQMWHRHEDKIIHQDTSLCLDSRQARSGLMITDCIQGEASQAWQVERETKAKQADQDYMQNVGML